VVPDTFLENTVSAILSLPLSGVVLSHIIDAFDLRRWDPNGTLSPRDGTATRFFKGERVGEDAELRIFRATGTALVESGVVPPVFLLGAPLPAPFAGALDKVPPGEMLAVFLGRVAGHWDELAGALRRASAPVFSERLARLACHQLVTIDLAVRISAVLWLTRSTIEEPPPTPWAVQDGMRSRLRDLHRTTGLSRDRLAAAARVDEDTLDAWLDGNVRPKDENLHDLVIAFSEHGAGDREALLRELRRAYGLRDLYARLVEDVGDEHASNIAQRLVGYAVWMLGLVRRSKKPVEENDLKMHMALTIGTLGRETLELKFVEAMLNSVWRVEVDPIWRTSIKAATRSWFERVQEVTAKLPPGDDERLAAVLGAVPPPEVLDQIGYLALASKEELARDSAMRAVMDSEADEGGYFGALELKIRANEAWTQGDRLRAIDLLREAVADDPCSAELHFRLGASLWQIADVDEGMRELEIAAQLDPGWDRAHVEVGIVLLNQDRNEEATRRLEAAKPLLRGPSTWLLLHLGHARERLGDIDGAVAAYEELLGLDDEHAEALDRLAHLYFVRGEKRKGAELAKRAAHLGFTDVFAAWTAKYYDRKDAKNRPPRTTREHLVQLGDNTWLKSRHVTTSFPDANERHDEPGRRQDREGERAGAQEPVH
jgi:Flp pilus assembly protein TadD